ncbi:MAG: relaxase/mobilization nuclease domain-containing protein [Bacteroidota bacterium]
MKNGKNIRGALSYNEAKVRAGNAELILASRYGCDAGDLLFSEKLKRFTLLNEKCITSDFNTVHISLNFSADDSIDTEKMQLIARDYMQALGFEKQPYLVYRHNDTAHPHLHIVTTPVKANGKTIYLHNLVKRKSEPARKQIEEQYKLVKAEGRKQSEGLKPVEVQAVQYGKIETKQAISQIVRSVADGWRFSRLEEFDLALRQYGVTADRGQPGTRMHERGGLQYFIVNAKGEKISVGIKASSIYTSPTIKNLEKRFSANTIKKQTSLQFTSAAVRFAFSRANSKNELVSLLRVKKIDTVESDGKLYFIDHRNKTVTTAHDLGIADNALEKLQAAHYADKTIDLTLFQKLIETEYTGPELANAFLKKKRKKKR